MPSKNKIKLIHSLEKKKYRTETGLFVAEGPKLMEELLSCHRPIYVAATEEWMRQNTNKLETGNSVTDNPKEVECETITAAELERISLLRTPQQVLALFELPKEQAKLSEIAQRELCLVLDGVQDPGNVGTIVRLADWFGIEHVFCSLETADIYSPKAIQATMGAIARVHVHYINILEEIRQIQSSNAASANLAEQIPIYGTHLDGENIYEKTLTQHGIIIMGNEGQGISPEVSALVNSRLYIPPYPANRDKVESLNVAIATAIVCAEFRRRG